MKQPCEEAVIWAGILVQETRADKLQEVSMQEASLAYSREHIFERLSVANDCHGA
jgi:hypothetical protein